MKRLLFFLLVLMGMTTASAEGTNLDTGILPQLIVEVEASRYKHDNLEWDSTWGATPQCH